MTWWGQIYVWLDLVLITPYRAFDNPVVGFYFGTLVLCMGCVFLGEVTYRLASVVNRDYIKHLRASMTKMHNLSVKALVLKDKENYKACNQEANEAFGKYFFNMITMGAAVLWPVAFALAWMNTRFGHIQFELLFPMPFLAETAGFPTVMIPMYVLCRILWARLKSRYPLFSYTPTSGSGAPEPEEMIRMKDLDKYGKVPDKFWYNGQS